jgi:type I restriction enzyme S subunit
MKLTVTPSHALTSQGQRLDASYHASAGVKVLRTLQQWANEAPARASENTLREFAAGYAARRLDRLSDVCIPGGVFIPGRFKRVYVDNPAHGAPYLTGGSILQVDPLSGSKLLSRRYTANIKELALYERMTLITCSGTIGNSVYVNGTFEGAVGSPDLIRILADPQKILPGYLYAFLNSPIGRVLIEQKTYGAVIPHIEAHHVVDLPIPRLDSASEERIHEMIEQAAYLRSEANKAKQQAQNLLTDAIPGVQSHHIPKTLAVQFPQNTTRLDGTYHAAQVATRSTYRQTSTDVVKIGDLLSDMFYLGKLHRVFVDDPSEGVPLLSISDVQKAKLTSEKYISRTRSRNVTEAMLQEGWVLVSRSGTPGIVVYTRREMVGMAGTDHLVRLVPNHQKVLPGYLFTILASPFGQVLLRSSVHGSVQLQLPPEYIGEIRIPVVDRALQVSIHQLISSYAEQLSLASEREKEAEALLKAALAS